MVQSHYKNKGSLSLPPIGGFIANIALSRKVRARRADPPPGSLPAASQPLSTFNFSNTANGLGRSSATGSTTGSAFHSAGTAASGLRG